MFNIDLETNYRLGRHSPVLTDARMLTNLRLYIQFTICNDSTYVVSISLNIKHPIMLLYGRSSLG